MYLNGPELANGQWALVFALTAVLIADMPPLFGSRPLVVQVGRSDLKSCLSSCPTYPKKRKQQPKETRASTMWWR
jgi:hypothetical protein